MDNIYPVITLYQPWATWIMREWKTIETRTHPRFSSLQHKTILIHAGMKTDDSDYSVKNPYLSKEQISQNPDEMVNGFILGSVFVSGFNSLYESHSKASLIDCKDTQRWGLFLENIKKFDNPIPCKGEMGIWYFDMKKSEKVKKKRTETLKLPF